MAAMGTAEIDFGAFPGSSHATVAVSGQAAIVLTSLVEAWIYPKATTDHSADEHLLETLKVAAQDIVAGVGFTIAAVNTSQLNEALLPLRGRGPTSISPNPTLSGALQSAQGLQMRTKGGNGTRLYGKFTVAWAWGDP